MPARNRPFGAAPDPTGCVPARRDLGERRDGEERRRRKRRGDQIGRVDLEREEEEERRGEQVAQRRDQLAGTLLGATGQRQADQERADRSGHLDLLRDAGDEQGDAEDGEEKGLVGAAGDQAAHPPAIAQCGEEDDRHRSEGDQHARTVAVRLPPTIRAATTGR